jgi:hypothetical protein
VVIGVSPGSECAPVSAAEEGRACVGRGRRPAEQIALAVDHAHTREQPGLFGGLDPFGDRADVELAAEFDARADDLGRAAILRDPAGEALVDLEQARRQPRIGQQAVEQPREPVVGEMRGDEIRREESRRPPARGELAVEGGDRARRRVDTLPYYRNRVMNCNRATLLKPPARG